MADGPRVAPVALLTGGHDRRGEVTGSATKAPCLSSLRVGEGIARRCWQCEESRPGTHIIGICQSAVQDIHIMAPARPARCGQLAPEGLMRTLLRGLSGLAHLGCIAVVTIG